MYLEGYTACECVSIYSPSFKLKNNENLLKTSKFFQLEAHKF